MSNTSAVIYIVLALAVGYAFAYPAYNDIFALMDEKQKYEDSLATVATIESRKNDLLAQFEAIPEEDKKSIETLLPSELSFVRLISHIDAVASKYGISIDNISTRSDNETDGSNIAEAEPVRPFQTSVIGFAFVSSYQNYRKFTEELERSLRILDTKTVSIKVQGDEQDLYAYSVEFNTYWIK